MGGPGPWKGFELTFSKMKLFTSDLVRILHACIYVEFDLR